jgi:hypothetical protein
MGVSILKLRSWLVGSAPLLFLLAGCQGKNATCDENEYSAGFERVGVLRSMDGGASWTFLGDACFHAPELIPVDPSPLPTSSGIALYFLDLKSLNQPTGSARVIYRAESSDGLAFTLPQPVFRFGETITDPYILQIGDGSYRMYLQHIAEVEDIISATSREGMDFELDERSRTRDGASPGALLLPDGRIRLFVAGDPRGIRSLISYDGLNFQMEDGIRIPADGISVTDPHPIQLQSGSYLMVYTVHPDGVYADEQARLAAIEIHISSSDDGLDWKLSPTTIGYGSVPGLVEVPGGDLYIYYVDASHRRSP